MKKYTPIALSIFALGLIVGTYFGNWGFNKKLGVFETQIVELKSNSVNLRIGIPNAKWCELLLTVPATDHASSNLPRSHMRVIEGKKQIFDADVSYSERAEYSWLSVLSLRGCTLLAFSQASPLGAKTQEYTVELRFEQKPLAGTKLWLVYATPFESTFRKAHPVWVTSY